jgi:hypothetical protein
MAYSRAGARGKKTNEAEISGYLVVSKLMK